MSGVALELDSFKVVSPCGFTGTGGVDVDCRLFGADAKVSFMPKTNQYSTIKEITVKGIKMDVLAFLPSLYINGMVNFFVKFGEPQ